MFGFNAYFYKNRIMIENVGSYKTNEVLLAYLEYDFPDLDELLRTCKEYERALHFPERGDEASKFDRMIQRAFMVYDHLDTITTSWFTLHSGGNCENNYSEMTSSGSAFFTQIDAFLVLNWCVP